MAEKKKILIIDDDFGIGEMMQVMLEFHGYEVIFSDRPEKTEMLVKAHAIDLVILDMLISGINGTNICKRLRKNDDPEIAEIPILMMSALHEAIIKCKKAGANDFIAKPFEMEQLISQVKKLLGS